MIAGLTVLAFVPNILTPKILNSLFPQCNSVQLYLRNIADISRLSQISHGLKYQLF